VEMGQRGERPTWYATAPSGDGTQGSVRVVHCDAPDDLRRSLSDPCSRTQYRERRRRVRGWASESMLRVTREGLYPVAYQSTDRFVLLQCHHMASIGDDSELSPGQVLNEKAAELDGR